MGKNTMRPSYFISSAMLAACLLVCLTESCLAQTFLIDDFNDGNDDGWTTVNTNQLASWGPGLLDATSGAYQFSTPGSVPLTAPARGVMYAVWDQSIDTLYSDGLIRTKVRVDEFDSGASIFFRFTGDLITGVNLYAFTGFGGRGFGFDRFEGGAETRDLNVPDIVMGLGEEWWMEAGAVGDQLAMKVWLDGEPEPVLPQLVFTDAALSSGSIALNANLNFGTDTEGPVNSTFDDVYFTPYGAEGDFDNDNDTDGADFLSWQRGESPIPLSSSDLAIWKASYGSASLPVTLLFVPEPTSMLQMVAIAPAWRAMRHRR